MEKQNNFDKNALIKACKKVASQTLWQTPNPIDITDIIDSEQIKQTTQKYFEEALRHVEFITEQKRDPNLITRAVLYLSESHAMPPMKEDITWFSNMLEALIELACPNVIHSGKSAEFLYDVEDGIEKIRDGSESATSGT